MHYIFWLVISVLCVPMWNTTIDKREDRQLITANLSEEKRSITDDEPVIYKKVVIPEPFLTVSDGLRYGGDIRIGDLTGNGKADLLVYRSARGASDGATKPNFLGAFTAEGKILWQKGEGGTQPSRPGPVAIYDIDADGQTEVICFFYDGQNDPDPYSMAGITIQVLNGATGEIETQAQPKKVIQSTGKDANWVHQRLLITNLRGKKTPQDIIIKLGTMIFALDNQLNILWSYSSIYKEYSRAPAYIPAVGDIDNDGRDEVNGGYYLLDHSGVAFWEKMLGPNMDSVAIDEWDNGNIRAFCSGLGHVMDKHGNILLKLGKKLVPHGQELRVANFDSSAPSPQMMIRYRGHHPDVMLVDNTGEVVRKFRLNSSPNNTGMEAVYWQGRDRLALLYNGGMLWRGDGRLYADLGLPDEVGGEKMGWYHCIPANLAGDDREEMVIYNPWDKNVYIFASPQVDSQKYGGYRPGPRQYNARLMD